MSAIVFVASGIVQKWYDLISIGLEKTKTFLTVWWQWTIVMTCLAYFGQEFIFKHGISRFIVIVVALSSLIIIPLVESVRRWFYRRWIKQFDHSILILIQDNSQDNIIQQLSLPDYFRVRTELFNTIDLTQVDDDEIILVG